MVRGRLFPEEVTVMSSLGRMTMVAALVLGGASTVRAEAAPAVYDAKCKVCHSIGGDAGKLADKGGPLDGVGAKRDEAWLRAYIADPKSKMPDAKMPVIKLTPEEMDACVKYMLSLK
jgi:nitric oxide reductase subunit C